VSPGIDRRGELVAASVRLIAADGMGGFTLRAVAQAAGIHHATLLHYFPSKATLLQAVVDHLLETLRTPLDDAPAVAPLTALEAIADEFRDIMRRLRRDMAMFVVMGELQLHARHAADVRAQLDRLDAALAGYLGHLLSRGVAEGTCRGDLDVASTRLAILVQIKGITLQAAAGAGLEDLDRAAEIIVAQLSGWLAA